MKVSVIVVNYNGKEFIGECINSILASDYPDIELIVVDNASTDGSNKILQKIYGKNNKVRLFYSKKQLYFTGGSNLGARKAKGDLLFFLNSDCTVEKDCIKEMVNFLQDKLWALVQPKILWKDNPTIIDNIGGRYNFLGFAFAVGRGEKNKGQHDQNMEFDYVNGTAFMTKRDFFWQLGGFDELFRYFYEDVDLSLRARNVGGKCWHCYRAVIYHKGSLTFKKTLSKKEIKQRIRKNRQLLRIKRFNYSMKMLVNKLRLWELERAVGKNNFSLLDLGCGDANLVQSARKRKITAIGVDKSRKDTLALHSIKVKDYFVRSTIEKLHLKKKFDAVVMYHVLEHLDKPADILQKIHKWLKQDGIFVIEAPIIGNLTEGFLGKDYFAYHDKTHKHFFAKQELIKLIEQSGFKIIKKGCTFYEFPLTLATTSIKQGVLKGIIGLILFLPFKLLSILGLNDEIIRLYCVKN